MKVLMINGSPRANGNTSIALHEMEKVFQEEGIISATRRSAAALPAAAAQKKGNAFSRIW